MSLRVSVPLLARQSQRQVVPPLRPRDQKYVEGLLQQNADRVGELVRRCLEVQSMTGRSVGEKGETAFTLAHFDRMDPERKQKLVGEWIKSLVSVCRFENPDLPTDAAYVNVIMMLQRDPIQLRFSL